MSLTVKQVQNAKPGRLCDGDGLYLLVKPSGTKSWVLRVQSEGKRRDWGIGSFAVDPIKSDLPLHLRSKLSLAEAREKARLGRELAKAGIDPTKFWRSQKVAPTIAPTFEKVARQHHEEMEAAWRNTKHAAQWLNTLQAYAFPELGECSVDVVDANAMQKVLLPIWLEKPETARRVKQRMIAVLDYAHAQGWRASEAPKGALNQLLKGIKQPRGGNFAALDYRKVPDLLAELGEAEPSVGRYALQFLILTASRSGEVRGATWKEIDIDAAEWRIEGLRMKAGKPHLVPLMPAALKILKEMAALFPNGPSDLLFPGLKGKPLSDATLSKVLRSAKVGEGTVHGLRSSFRDWAAENGFNNDWAEAALAHSVAGQSGKTVAAYKRTTYFEQRRDKLMPAWTTYACADNSNVVVLHPKKPATASAISS